MFYFVSFCFKYVCEGGGTILLFTLKIKVRSSIKQKKRTDYVQINNCEAESKFINSSKSDKKVMKYLSSDVSNCQPRILHPAK